MELRIGAAYGGGWYVLNRRDLDPPRYQVIRTSDGTLRELIPPSGRVYSVPVYVSEHEMLLGDDGMVRIDPHTLPIVPE